MRTTTFSLPFLFLMAGLQLAQASIIPSGASLGLSPGDKYHILFVTSGTATATSTNIADYDAFVQTAADTAGIGGSINWVALASTSTVNAITHADVQGPVFLLNGTKIANDASDLWDGSVAARIDIDETGAAISSAYVVWTGSTSGGVAASPLGVASPTHGSAFFTGTFWVSLAVTTNSSGLRLYGISEAFTVPTPSAVPEPGSLSMLLLGGAAFAAFARRKAFRR
jgi:hypothetical protein